MTKKRFIAILLSVLLLVQAMPLNVLAEQAEEQPMEPIEMRSVTSEAVDGETYAQVVFVTTDPNDPNVAYIQSTMAVAIGASFGGALPEAPAVEGMVFDRWVDASGATVDANTVVTENMTVTALYYKDTPAATFTGQANGVVVRVSAPAGAFPEGATMTVSAVSEGAVEAIVNEVMDGGVSNLRAVDVSFQDAEGNDIEPERDVAVVMYSYVNPEAESKVVHIDDAGEANVVADMEGNRANFQIDGFSIYVVVETQVPRLTVRMHTGGEDVDMIIKAADTAEIGRAHV